nr:hypothetical protein [Tanacetum cinerariifolium]
MVNTRNNNLVLNTPPPTNLIQAALAAIWETLANTQAKVRTYSTEIAKVVKKFGVLYDDPIVELKNLKQTGSVQTYQEVFDVLLNRVSLPELVAVSMFMGGLKPEVGSPMRMFQAVTLSETYGLARMQEATNTILKPMYDTPLLPTPKQSTTTYDSKAVTTPVNSNSVGQSSGYVTRNGVHKPYRLTQIELEDKRAKG